MNRGILRGVLAGFLGLFIFMSPCLSGAEPQEGQGAKVLVVYYSRDGHTKMVAERLAEKFGADIEALVDKKKRIGPVAMSVAGKDAVAGNLTKLGRLNHDPRQYDLILIGTPSWFGHVTPAVRTFIKENDLSGKKIGIFGTAHLTGVEKALQETALLVAGDKASAVPVMPLRHRDLVDDILNQKIETFYQEMGRLA